MSKSIEPSPEAEGVQYQMEDVAQAFTTPKLRFLVDHLRQRMRPVDTLPSSKRWTAWAAFAAEYQNRCATRSQQTTDADLAARIAARVWAGAKPPTPAAAMSHAADEDEFSRRHPVAARVADAALDHPAADTDPWLWHRRLLAAAGYSQARPQVQQPRHTRAAS